MQNYVVAGFFAKIEGSLAINGTVEGDECGGVAGGIDLTGKIGVSVGARAYVVGVVDAVIAGGAEISATGKFLYKDKAIHMIGQIGWGGVTVTVSLKDAVAGWFEYQRQWVVYPGKDNWLGNNGAPDDLIIYTF